MIYVQVKRDKDGKFYHLNEEKNINDLYELTTFKALDDIQVLASMNGMEFIMYKKKIDELRNLKKSSILHVGDRHYKIFIKLTGGLDTNRYRVPLRSCYSISK